MNDERGGVSISHPVLSTSPLPFLIFLFAGTSFDLVEISLCVAVAIAIAADVS